MWRCRWCAFCEIRRAARAAGCGRGRHFLPAKRASSDGFRRLGARLCRWLHALSRRRAASHRSAKKCAWQEVRRTASFAAAAPTGAGASCQQSVHRATDLPAGRRGCVSICTLCRGRRRASAWKEVHPRATPARRRKQKSVPPRVRTGRRACSGNRELAARGATRTWAARCRSGSTWSRRG